MILEVQKIADQFVIKNPPKSSEAHFFLHIEKKNILKRKPVRKGVPKMDIAFLKLKELANKYPDDDLIQNLLKYYKPHQESCEKTDDEIYHEYLMERYGK